MQQREQPRQEREVSRDEHMPRLEPKSIAQPNRRVVGLQIAGGRELRQCIARAPEDLRRLFRAQLADVPDHVGARAASGSPVSDAHGGLRASRRQRPARVFLRSDVTCANSLKRVSTGVMSIAGGEWVDAQTVVGSLKMLIEYDCATPRFRALFSHLLGDHAPLVIHCTAGKDRTGFACALILHALGVPDDLIAEDYLLTNRFYRRDPNASDLPEEIKVVLGSVQASFLAAAFEAISAEYGDLECYFGDGLGLGPAERTSLVARYLDG